MTLFTKIQIDHSTVSEVCPAGCSVVDARDAMTGGLGRDKAGKSAESLPNLESIQTCCAFITRCNIMKYARMSNCGLQFKSAQNVGFALDKVRHAHYFNP